MGKRKAQQAKERAEEEADLAFIQWMKEVGDHLTDAGRKRAPRWFAVQIKGTDTERELLLRAAMYGDAEALKRSATNSAG